MTDSSRSYAKLMLVKLVSGSENMSDGLDEVGFEPATQASARGGGRRRPGVARLHRNSRGAYDLASTAFCFGPKWCRDAPVAGLRRLRDEGVASPVTRFQDNRPYTRLTYVRLEYASR